MLGDNELDMEWKPGDELRSRRSELCRNRLKPRRPPKLDRPAVEVELRALDGIGGVGGVRSSDLRPKELTVEDLSRSPKRRGGWSIGEEPFE